jgi:hypothetical protein
LQHLKPIPMFLLRQNSDQRDTPHSGQSLARL